MTKIFERAARTATRCRQILSAEQQARLIQLAVQSQGNLAPVDPDVSRHLEVTDEQKSAILDAIQAYQREREERTKNFETEIEKKQELERIASARKRSVESKLTPAQIHRWREPCGEPFDWDQPLD